MRETNSLPVDSETMIRNCVKVVQGKQRWRCVYRGLVNGLLVASVICIFASLAQFWFPVSVVMQLTAFAIVMGGLLTGTFAGWLSECTALKAAAAIDFHFGWKDCVASAWRFAAVSNRNSWHRLQFSDTAARLQAVDVRQVVRFELPRHTGQALLATCFAACLWCFPFFEAATDAGSVLPAFSEVAELIEQDLMQLKRQLNDTVSDGSFPELLSLQQELARLRSPGLSLRNALAAISTMQQTLRQSHARQSIADTNRQLQALGNAMQAASELQTVGAALQDSLWQAAAQELDQLNDAGKSFSANTDAAEKLAAVAEAMQQAGMSEMSDTVAKLSEHIAGRSIAPARDPLQQLAAELRDHLAADERAQLMNLQARRLSDYKAHLRSTAQPGSELTALESAGSDRDSSQSSDESGAGAESGEMSGTGAGPGSGNAPGSTSVGNQSGEITSLRSERQLSRITGQQSGTGRIDYEKVRSDGPPTADQREAQEAREIATDYRRLSEAALEGEQIPFRHRDTIRRYFETLRRAVDGNRRP